MSFSQSAVQENKEKTKQRRVICCQQILAEIRTSRSLTLAEIDQPIMYFRGHMLGFSKLLTISVAEDIFNLNKQCMPWRDSILFVNMMGTSE